MKNNKFNVKSILAAGVLSIGIASTAFAAPSDNYILFLPTMENVTYDIDSSHFSEKYSTDEYTILLYKPGEVVRVSVDGNTNYTIQDALENTEFDSILTQNEGNVTFIMPEKDLSFVFTDEQQTEAVQTETEAQTQEETAEGTVQTEEVVAETITEAATEATTEVPAEETQPAPTGAVEPGHIRVKVASAGNAKAIMPGGEEIEFPENKVYDTTSVMDLVRVYSDNGFNGTPNVNVYKNGEFMNDTSSIIINKGSETKLFTIDIKNNVSLESDGYEIQIIEPGHEAEISANETQGNNETEVQDVTETEAETEVQAPTENVFLEELNNTEPEQTETEVPVAEEVQTETTNTADVTNTGENQFKIELNLPETEPATEIATEAPETEAVSTEAPEVSTEVAADVNTDLNQVAAETEEYVPEFETIVLDEIETEEVPQTEMQQPEAQETEIQQVEEQAAENQENVSTFENNNISITSGIEEPLIIIFADGSIDTLTSSDVLDKDIAGIEVVGKFNDGTKPYMVIRRNGVLDDVVIANQELLSNGHYYFEFDESLTQNNDVIKITIA